MYENIRIMLFLFPILVHTILCCDPKDAISLEQENRFRNIPSLGDMMQAASSDVLNLACEPDDLECKKIQLRMQTDANEQDKQRKRCDACLKSYRCAKLKKCEPCEKNCRIEFVREIDNVGSVNGVDDYSAYFTLGEFGPGFQMDQIADLLGLPEMDKYEKVVVIGKTKDQSTPRKCKALLIDTAESFKDIKGVKCSGIVLKKTDTEQKLVAPSYIKNYIEAAENHLITDLNTERTIVTLSKNDPIMENILNSDFTENTQGEYGKSKNGEMKTKENVKATRTRIDDIKLNKKLGEVNEFVQNHPENLTETVKDSNEFTKWSEKRLIKPSLRKGILKIKNNSEFPLMEMESITETNLVQNSDSQELLKTQMKDSDNFSTTYEKLDNIKNFKPHFNSLSSSDLKSNDNITFVEYYLNQNLSSPNNISTAHQTKSQQHMLTRLLTRKQSRMRPNTVSNRNKVSSILSVSNSDVEGMSLKENTNPLQSEDSTLSNESYLGVNKKFKDKEPLHLLELKRGKMVLEDQKETLESNIDEQLEYPGSIEGSVYKKDEQPLISSGSLKNEETSESILMPQDKLLSPLEKKFNLKSKNFQENKTLRGKIGSSKAVYDLTDKIFIEKGSTTADFLEEEYRDLEQLQKLYITTPKINTSQNKWREEYPSEIESESFISTPFDGDINATIESENQIRGIEKLNKDILKSSKERKTTEKVLAVPKARFNINREKADRLKQYPSETKNILTESFVSTPFDGDTNATIETEDQSRGIEKPNKDILKSSKERKTTEKSLAVPIAHFSRNREKADGLEQLLNTQKTLNTKSDNSKTNDFPQSKEIVLENEFTLSTEKAKDSLDSIVGESEADSGEFVSEPTKEETFSNETDQNSNINKESNTILMSSESRKANTILPLIKQKHVPLLKPKVSSSSKQEHSILPKSNSNITYFELEEEKTKLIPSNQIKDKLEEASTVSKNINASVEEEQNLDSLVEALRSDNYSAEVPKEANLLLKSIKEKLKSSNRKLKVPKNVVSAKLPHESNDLLNESLMDTNSSKLENDNTSTDLEEQLKISSSNRKLKVPKNVVSAKLPHESNDLLNESLMDTNSSKLETDNTSTELEEKLKISSSNRKLKVPKNVVSAKLPHESNDLLNESLMDTNSSKLENDNTSTDLEEKLKISSANRKLKVPKNVVSAKLPHESNDLLNESLMDTNSSKLENDNTSTNLEEKLKISSSNRKLKVPKNVVSAKLPHESNDLLNKSLMDTNSSKLENDNTSTNLEEKLKISSSNRKLKVPKNVVSAKLPHESNDLLNESLMDTNSSKLENDNTSTDLEEKLKISSSNRKLKVPKNVVSAKLPHESNDLLNESLMVTNSSKLENDNTSTDLEEKLKISSANRKLKVPKNVVSAKLPHESNDLLNESLMDTNSSKLETDNTSTELEQKLKISSSNRKLKVSKNVVSAKLPHESTDLLNESSMDTYSLKLENDNTGTNLEDKLKISSSNRKLKVPKNVVSAKLPHESTDLLNKSLMDKNSSKLENDITSTNLEEKLKISSPNRKLKVAKNVVSSKLPHESTDLLNESLMDTNSSKLENGITNTDLEEKLKISAHANKKLKTKHVFPTNTDPHLSRRKQKTDEVLSPTKQIYTKSFNGESDIVSGTPSKTESSSLDNVLKAKHLDSLVQELEQLPPLIYDRALKVSSALTKLQSTSQPSKNLIQLLSTKNLQGEESKNDFVETKVPNSVVSDLTAFRIKSDEEYEDVDDPEEASHYLKGVDFNYNKIISSERNIKSEDFLKIANKFNEDTADVNTPPRDAEAHNEKSLRANKKEPFLKKKSEKKIKENFDDSTVQSSEKRKEKGKQLVGKLLQSIYSATANSDQVGDPHPEIPSKENIFKNFGRVVPNINDYPSKANSLTDNLLFLGNGIHLPLNAKRNEDGSYKLSLDIEKLCDCKELGCNKHAPEIVEEKRNIRGATHVNSDIASQDKVTTLSNFLGQLRKISKTSSHPEISKS